MLTCYAKRTMARIVALLSWKIPEIVNIQKTIDMGIWKYLSDNDTCFRDVTCKQI